MVEVKFTFDPQKARAAILYLTGSEGRALDKYRVCKMLFLADKLHLVRYGRTITGDDYWALPHGPAPTTVLNVLDAVLRGSVFPGSRALLSAIEIDDTVKHPRIRATQEPDWDCLSKSDIEALDLTLERYGRSSFKKLWKLTHSMSAYKNAWDQRGTRRSSPMSFEDFFDGDHDVVDGVLEEVREDSETREAFAVS